MLGENNKSIKGVALDFDYTTGHFADGEQGLREILVRRGVADDAVSDILDTAHAQGFTIEKCIGLMRERYPDIQDGPGIRSELFAWFEKNLKPYEDSAGVLKHIHRKKIHLFFVTFGDQKFQQKKIRTLGFHHPDTAIHVVEPPRSKAIIIKWLHCLYDGTILFADDDPSELDDVREMGLTEKQVITVRVVRPDSPHRDIAARHPHIEVGTLAEIVPLLS